MLFFSKLVLNVKTYFAFEVQKVIKNILETTDIGNVVIYKKTKVPFSSTMLRLFHDSPKFKVKDKDMRVRSIEVIIVKV